MAAGRFSESRPEGGTQAHMARTAQLTRQQGQGMVEYALILVLVSIVVIVVLLTMGNQINNVFSNVVVALGGS
jgi:pilus assembly protein Flp/PilA